MPAARGVKRSASKTAASTASVAPKSKKKRGAVQLEIPKAPKKCGFVMACGQGDVGQLGFGEEVVETTKFKKVNALGNKIVAACAGGMHTIALDNGGKVWTYGCNDEGALGRPTNGEKDEFTPKKVTLPGKAVTVTAGDSHSSALLENGDVYAWGSFRDSHGSMGLVVRGRQGKSCLEPVRLSITEPAVSIASGGDHLVVLTTSGSVYTMGCGEQGQLGRLSQRSASRDARQGFSALLAPSKVTLKGGASHIWAGYHGTFVLDANQEKLYAFGLNNYGQLGISDPTRRSTVYTPTVCDMFPPSGAPWASVAVGQHHTLALSSSGRVHSVGRWEYGRLGLGDISGDATGLQIVPTLQDKRCISISAGTSNSFAVTETGEVYAWGMGSEGQLGTGSTSDSSQPTLASHPGARCVCVSAGGMHTVLRAEDPNAQKEPSPDPESETEEDKVEEEEKTEEESKKPRAKRAKKEQEGEVTSTSDAQASDVGDETVPQKVNGDDNKDTEMEVDETDKAEDKKDSEQKMDTDQNEPEPKPETLETSSQETSDSEGKSQEDSQDSTKTQDSDLKLDSDKSPGELSQDSDKSQEKDVDMKAEINGTEEKVEAKTVDVIPQTNQLTTTA